MKTFVTKPYLPPKHKFIKKLTQIYESEVLTNNGRFVIKLEEKLRKRFGVKNVIAIANGTLALQVSIKALQIKGEVITSPFSYIATSGSLMWEGIKPIFADIDPHTFNISLSNIDKKISKNTTAVMPVHVFGNPNEIEGIKKICRKYNLKTIYDASHCFDINYKNKSILNHGDCSVVSFHATKIFHSIEGGAIFTNNDRLAKKIRSLRNFGFIDRKIKNIGINAKMNEFEAAMGLLVLDDMKKITLSRKKIYMRYSNKINIKFKRQLKSKFSNNNYSYFPIIFENEQQLKKTIKVMNSKNIFPRRYFYPSLNKVKVFTPSAALI